MILKPAMDTLLSIVTNSNINHNTDHSSDAMAKIGLAIGVITLLALQYIYTIIGTGLILAISISDIMAFIPISGILKLLTLILARAYCSNLSMIRLLLAYYNDIYINTTAHTAINKLNHIMNSINDSDTDTNIDTSTDISTIDTTDKTLRRLLSLQTKLTASYKQHLTAINSVGDQSTD